MTVVTKSDYMSVLEAVREAGGVPKMLEKGFEAQVVRSALGLMDIGKRTSEAGMPTFIEKTSDLSPEVRELLLSAGNGEAIGTQVTIWMMRPRHGGQEGGGNSNLMAVIMPRNFDYAGGVVTVEMGCDHTMTGRNLGRCYNEYRCTKCDYYYRVDSSD